MRQPAALWWQHRSIVGKVLRRRIFCKPGVMREGHEVLAGDAGREGHFVNVFRHWWVYMEHYIANRLIKTV